MKWLRWLWLSAFLAACSSAAPDIKPPEIVYGEDVCEACGMLISDARFAAASVEADGTAHKFDDIGDLIGYYAQKSSANVRAYFVHDYPSEQWLRAEEAAYIISADIHTPMAHGVAAFIDRAAAAAAAKKYGVPVLSFQDLKKAKLPMAMPRVP